MTSTMTSTAHRSSKELSRGILEVSENCEYAKVLQSHIATTDEKSILQLESNIAGGKWAIFDYLSSSSNYDDWRASENNNGEMLLKYAQKGYFVNEFAGTKIKEKLQRDFGDSLAANPELGITKREKATLKHYEDNMVPEHKRTFSKEHEAVVANIHDKDKCFSKNLSNTLSDLPNKLSKNAEKALTLIQGNPLLLKDNPEHGVVNRGGNNPSVTAAELKEIIEDASLGDDAANTKLAALVKSMEEMDNGETSRAVIEENRKKYLANSGPSVTPKNNG